MSVSTGIVKGGRLTQVSIVRSFSKKFFDDCKTVEITARSVRANFMSQQLSRSFYGTRHSGSYQYLSPLPYGIHRNRPSLLTHRLSLQAERSKHTTGNRLKHVASRTRGITCFSHSLLTWPPIDLRNSNFYPSH